MVKLSVVVPCYNEEEVIHETYEILKKEIENKINDYEIIFVNDGSKDKTLNILKQIALNDKKIKIIDFARNFGHQIAITAGLDFAIGEYICFIDGDLQDPPKVMMEMVELIEKEKYNVVYGKRKKRKGETIFKKVTAKIYYRFLDSLSSTPIPVDVGDFRVIDRKVADILKKIKEKDRFVRGLVAWSGFKQCAIEFEREERKAGETKYTLKKMIKLSLDGILSFSTKPLGLSTLLGFIISIITVLLLIFGLIFNMYNISNLIIELTILLIGSINLICLGILGQYIGRIYNEVRNRPIYVVNDLINLEEN